MKDLFDDNLEENLRKEAPLAERMRPRDFEYFYGQEDLVGLNSPLRQTIQNDNLTSLIFWGPPGSGKTTLARIIAEKTKCHFIKFSAVNAGVKEVRDAIETAHQVRKFYNKRTILFIDEIHRFNKAQQDSLLLHVENGTVILIGATTENPSFEVISPLLSRSAVYVLKPLSDKAMEKIILRGFGEIGENMKITKKDFMKSRNQQRIKEKDVSEILKEHALRYDKKGEEHYNVISAFIKSMRDSDPDGALYWLARMIESGEDPRFIARRMVIFASEDISNADPNALVVAVSVARAVEYVGMPEAQINLAQGVTYLSSAPKNNASYMALLEALKDAKQGSFGVPLHLRNAVTNLMKELNYGKGYKYAHDFPDAKQTHFPKEIGEKKYYFPKKK